jgi:hypothetical protein
MPPASGIEPPVLGCGPGSDQEVCLRSKAIRTDDQALLPIARALDIPGQAILDGEVVVVHEGRANFSELQAELARGRQARMFYYAFDLWRNGPPQAAGPVKPGLLMSESIKKATDQEWL